MPKPKRVDCFYCQNFICPKFDDLPDNTFISKIRVSAKCKLGKRVMFRINGHPDRKGHEIGYFRYCSEFKEPEA